MKIFNVFKRVEKLESDIVLMRYNISCLQEYNAKQEELNNSVTADSVTAIRKPGIWCRGCEYFDEGLITSPSGRSATVMTCKLNHVCADRKEAVKCSGECKNE